MEIAVATIAAVGAIIVALVQRSRRENSDDHRMVMDSLRKVGSQVTRIDEKVERLDAKVERIDEKVERYASHVDEATGRDSR
jgi:predicted RNase H-like nuclease (RuvC/YqgF family)